MLNPIVGVIARKRANPYRILFITSVQVPGATSTDIASINSWCASIAEAVTELDDLNTNWYVLGATSSVDVYTNTSTEPGVDLDTPIYFTDGTKIFDDLTDLWTSGTNTININENGDVQTAGSTAIHTGLESGPVTSSGNELDAVTISHGGRDSGYNPWYGVGDTWAGGWGNTSLFVISDVVYGNPPSL